MGLSAVSGMVLYGRGNFTTIALFDSEPFLFDLHWARLMRDAALVGNDTESFDKAEVLAELTSLITAKGIVSGKARVTFYDESPSTFWGGDAVSTSSKWNIIAASRRAVSSHFRLGISEHLVNSTSPLSGVKSCNYLDPLLTLEKANGKGFDEAIRLNERGIVTSACMANVFWLTNGRLYTPSLTTGCIAGTTREFILENLECEEAEAGIEAVRSADAVFLSSAGIGVVQAAELDGKALEAMQHPIMKLLPHTA